MNNNIVKINSKNTGTVYINLDNIIGISYEEETGSIRITAIDGQTYKISANKEDFDKLFN